MNSWRFLNLWSRLCRNPCGSLKTISRISHYQSFEIPKYLLDRTVPAEEILNKLTADDAQRLEVIKAEYRFSIDQGQKVSENLTAEHWLNLLCCPSLSARHRYHLFLFKREKHRENFKAKKLNKVPTTSVDKPPSSLDRIIRVIDSRCIKEHQEAWMRAEIRCPEAAQQLVFDFTHESEMRIQDQKNLASQMVYVMQTTRQMKPYPFHLVLCGLQPNTNQYRFLEEHFGVHSASNLRNLTDLPWSISPNPYSDDFPIDNPEKPVIYLSPNAPRSFEPGEWDHNAVYVIGAIVDKVVRRPVTFAKARRTGVQCIRLPLERYFNWSSGSSKTLTINCIHAVLATAKSTNGDWEKALKLNLPKRLYDRPDPGRSKLNRMLSMI